MTFMRYRDKMARQVYSRMGCPLRCYRCGFVLAILFQLTAAVVRGLSHFRFCEFDGKGTIGCIILSVLSETQGPFLSVLSNRQHFFVSVLSENTIVTCTSQRKYLLLHLLTALHNDLVQHYRTFLMVGGMPASVAAWITSHDYRQCQTELDDIQLTYYDDFVKYVKKVDPALLRNTD